MYSNNKIVFNLRKIFAEYFNVKTKTFENNTNAEVKANFASLTSYMKKKIIAYFHESSSTGENKSEVQNALSKSYGRTTSIFIRLLSCNCLIKNLPICFITEGFIIAEKQKISAFAR